MGEMPNAYKYGILIGNPEGRRPLGDIESYRNGM
jgi:hypothetical protein